MSPSLHTETGWEVKEGQSCYQAHTPARPATQSSPHPGLDPPLSSQSVVDIAQRGNIFKP